LGFLKTILARYHHEVKHMVVLTIFVAALDYGFKQEEPYFQLFALADKLNLGLVLKFKQEEGQLIFCDWIYAEPPTCILQDIQPQHILLKTIL